MELTTKQNTIENAVKLTEVNREQNIPDKWSNHTNRLVSTEQKGWRTQTLQCDSYKSEFNEMISYLCKAFMAMTIHLHKVKTE